MKGFKAFEVKKTGWNVLIKILTIVFYEWVFYIIISIAITA